MPLELHCTCRRGLTIRDELAGKLVRCPSCGAGLRAPMPVTEVLDDGRATPMAVTEFIEEIPASPAPASAESVQPTSADLIPWSLETAEALTAAPAIETPKAPEPRKKKKRSVYSEHIAKDRHDDSSIPFDESWFAWLTGAIAGGSIILVFGILVLILLFTFGHLWIGKGALFLAALVIIFMGAGLLVKGLYDSFE